eukprot:5852484-Amphidinium_carterae.2
MMCFATFCMAPDSSQPPGIVAELADQGEWSALRLEMPRYLSRNTHHTQFGGLLTLVVIL